MTEEAVRHRRPSNKTRGGGILKSNPKYSANPNPNARHAAAVVADRLGGDGVVDLNNSSTVAVDGSYGRGAGEEQAVAAAVSNEAEEAHNKPLVRDVVERDPRKASETFRGRPISASAGTSSSSAIEGYSPVTGAGSASATVGIFAPATSNEIGIMRPPTERDEVEAGPIAALSSKATHPPSAERTSEAKSGGATIVRSISELVAMAQGTSDEAAEGVNVAELRRKQEAGEEVAVETEMSFACMTEDEYKETIQLAERLELLGEKDGTKISASTKKRDEVGYHDVKETDATDDADEGEQEGVTDVDFEEGCMLNDGGDEPSMEEVFFGKQTIFGEDTDDDDDSENVERNEEYEGDRGSSGGGGDASGDGFIDFFGVDDDDSVGEPEPAPKPFIQLWNAMSSWITPETAQILQEWDKDIVSGDADASALSSALRQPYDTSDIGASRCGGLMSMVKMNLPRALEELGFDRSDSHVRRLAGARLANFVRTFNYSDPMVKFDSTLWKALTIVLVGICFPSSLLYPDVVDELSGNDNDGETSTPATIQQLGITVDEYRYLTKSALKSLSVSGA